VPNILKRFRPVYTYLFYRGYFEEVFSSQEEKNSTSNSNNTSDKSNTDVDDGLILKKEHPEDIQDMLDSSKNVETNQGNTKFHILGLMKAISPLWKNKISPYMCIFQTTI
jgi:hypothetical protein